MSIATLLATNVNEHTERKQNLTYLSWAWAWAEALKADPKATYKVEMFDGKCFMDINGTAMVWVTVTIFDKAMTCQLPVMDHRNKAITKPDAFSVNTAIMRCMTKALSLHGLGLYIYAGEDLPESEQEEAAPTINEQQEAEIEALIDEVKADKNGLLNWVSQNTNTQVKSISQIPNVAYVHVIKILEKKRSAA